MAQIASGQNLPDASVKSLASFEAEFAGIEPASATGTCVHRLELPTFIVHFPSWSDYIASRPKLAAATFRTFQSTAAARCSPLSFPLSTSTVACVKSLAGLKTLGCAAGRQMCEDRGSKASGEDFRFEFHVRCEGHIL